MSKETDREAACDVFKPGRVAELPKIHGLTTGQLEATRNMILQAYSAGRVLSNWVEDLQSQLHAANERAKEAESAANIVDAEFVDQPRTIVLMYKPFKARPDDIPFDPMYDLGGSWDIGENGDYQTKLDAREALALVAAMLLGAPHPRLKSIDEHEKLAQRDGEDNVHRAADAIFAEDITHG
ncbi:MAG: hypothetical protein V4641_05740 [Pseudomonadota bacterium]